MLTQLIVKDFTLVDSLELEFHAGMSVISGETGTGKSIILNALALALGDRADTTLIADGATRAEISASFDIGNHSDANAWLQERELSGVDSHECILRRLIGRDGRSRGFINGTPATVADMKALGDMLIDIHSQHEHQSLLKRDTQRKLLDEFGDHVTFAQEVRDLYHQHRAASEQLSSLIANSEEQSSRLQLLNYQATELNELAIAPGEHEQLENEHKRLANAESVLNNCHQAIELCQQDDNGNALQYVSSAIQLLNNIDDDAIHSVTELLDSSRIQIQEAIHDLDRFKDEFEVDPGRLQEVETRLSDIYEIARKHRVDPGEIPDLEKRINEELGSLENIDTDIETLTEKTEKLNAGWHDAAKKLGKARRTTADLLGKKVSDQLQDLGMAGATFAIKLAQNDDPGPAPHGSESVEFLVSTNPGQEPRPLGKIASGGELSRISLAIQVATADTTKVPTLVFDEVDVGIGGGVAEVIGHLLRQLGNKTQILCVTHLPQVAAQGHCHYRVTKSADESGAATSITPLSDTEKVAEIARMLGGVEMTEQSMAHAREMFRKAQYG